MIAGQAEEVTYRPTTTMTTTAKTTTTTTATVDREEETATTTARKQLITRADSLKEILPLPGLNDYTDLL